MSAVFLLAKRPPHGAEVFFCDFSVFFRFENEAGTVLCRRPYGVVEVEFVIARQPIGILEVRAFRLPPEREGDVAVSPFTVTVASFA